MSLIHNPSVENFAFLAGQQDLCELQVTDCIRVTDLSALAALPLRSLKLGVEHLPRLRWMPSAALRL